jgi:hypothetical protein
MIPGAVALPQHEEMCGREAQLSDCLHTRKHEAIFLLPEYKKERDCDKTKANFKNLGNNETTTDNRDVQTAFLTAWHLEVKVTVLADAGSDYSYIPQCCGGQKEALIPSQVRGVAGAHHAEHGYQGRKRQAEVQYDVDAYVRDDYRHAVGASVHA